jgi:hypothetical protein
MRSNIFQTSRRDGSAGLDKGAFGITDKNSLDSGDWPARGTKKAAALSGWNGAAAM